MGVAAYPVIAAGGGYSLYKGHQYANPQDPYAAPPGGVSPLFSPQAAQRLVVNNLAGETAAPEIRKRREDAQFRNNAQESQAALYNAFFNDTMTYGRALNGSPTRDPLPSEPGWSYGPEGIVWRPATVKEEYSDLLGYTSRPALEGGLEMMVRAPLPPGWNYPSNMYYEGPPVRYDNLRPVRDPMQPMFQPPTPTQKATSKARKSSKPKPKSKLPVDNYPKAKPRMRSKNRNEE